MKTLTVPEAKERLPEIIAEVNRGETIVLSDGTQTVTLYPGSGVDAYDYDPELEAELVKALEGKSTPYVPGELRERTERLIQLHAKK